jgi:hypothetical protein
VRNARTGLILLGIVVGTMPLAGPTTAAETTSVAVSGATVGTSTIAVTGAIDFGTDVTGDLLLGEDPSGDATVKGAGLDIGSISVRPDIAGKKLIWTLTVTDGAAAIGGAPPMTGYMVPIMNGQDKWRWLAAGTEGSNFGQSAKWTGVCQNELADGTQGGWSCPTMISGSVTPTAITWTQRFTEMSPAIAYGSMIESSSILCGAPCTFAWPVGAVGAASPVDTMGSMNAYKVPGEVTLAIAPTGANPGAFTTKATFNGTSKTFAGSVPKPANPGNYTVWAQTCFGDGYEPTCVVGSRDITI